jgi:hypothetical protein
MVQRAANGWRTEVTVAALQAIVTDESDVTRIVINEAFRRRQQTVRRGVLTPLASCNRIVAAVLARLSGPSPPAPTG